MADPYNGTQAYWQGVVPRTAVGADTLFGTQSSGSTPQYPTPGSGLGSGVVPENPYGDDYSHGDDPYSGMQQPASTTSSSSGGQWNPIGTSTALGGSNVGGTASPSGYGSYSGGSGMGGFQGFGADAYAGMGGYASGIPLNNADAQANNPYLTSMMNALNTAEGGVLQSQNQAYGQIGAAEQAKLGSMYGSDAQKAIAELQRQLGMAQSQNTLTGQLDASAKGLAGTGLQTQAQQNVAKTQLEGTKDTNATNLAGINVMQYDENTKANLLKQLFGSSTIGSAIPGLNTGLGGGGLSGLNTMDAINGGGSLGGPNQPYQRPPQFNFTPMSDMLRQRTQDAPDLGLINRQAATDTQKMKQAYGGFRNDVYGGADRLGDIQRLANFQGINKVGQNEANQWATNQQGGLAAAQQQGAMYNPEQERATRERMAQTLAQNQTGQQLLGMLA